MGFKRLFMNNLSKGQLIKMLFEKSINFCLKAGVGHFRMNF
jgi:hypothetical protein